MRKRYLLIVVVVVFFQTFVPSFLNVEAKSEVTSQPEVCSWPSEMMSNYFNFQSEAVNILFKSEMNERLLDVSFGSWGLFSNKVLDLSAIDLIARSLVWNFRSSASNLLTSAVLLLLVSSSVVQSNVEWWAILFKDRPIVRDYKSMLDIETQLFDVAYFRSKQINLLHPLEWDSFDGLSKLIKKYQDIWLLEKGNELSKNSSMADVLSDLLLMNAAMKHFIMVGGKLWKLGLSKYHWCFWAFDKSRCNDSTFALKFSESAINQLYNDYKDVDTFSACNSYVSFFRNSIGNAVSNGKESVKTSVQDVKNSMNNLWGALIGKWRRNFKNNRKSLCEWISDYEMAQLRAYWWQNWTCWDWFNASFDSSDLSLARIEVEGYAKEKKAKKEQKEKLDRGVTQEKKNFTKLWSWVTSNKKQDWYDVYWTGSEYNPEFSSELNSGFNSIFFEVMNQYWQSLEDAISSDISDLLPRGKWILDQVNTTMENTDKLKDVLQKIADKQCSA